MKDAYRSIAGIYDNLFENMNKGLRLAGVRIFRPSKGMSILDVACGTGVHLQLYQRFECILYGIDISPSMLEVARKRLGDSARLELGDATRMPYADHQFNLIICMLALHEMNQKTRSGVLAEMKRVLKVDGRILLIDFHPGPYQKLQGRISQLIIFITELAAGKEHFNNYRQFLRNKGLQTLAVEHGLRMVKQSILGNGTFAVCLFQL